MRRLLLVTVVFALLGFASAALGQNIRNPSGLSFTASPDHALVTSYVLGYFAPGATQPTQEVDLGKPAPDATQTIAVSINIHPLSFGVAYVAKVKAISGALASDWSEPSNPFDRVPGKTGVPVLVK